MPWFLFHVVEHLDTYVLGIFVKICGCMWWDRFEFSSQVIFGFTASVRFFIWILFTGARVRCAGLLCSFQAQLVPAGRQWLSSQFGLAWHWPGRIQESISRLYWCLKCDFGFLCNKNDFWDGFAKYFEKEVAQFTKRFWKVFFDVFWCWAVTAYDPSVWRYWSGQEWKSP